MLLEKEQHQPLVRLARRGLRGLMIGDAMRHKSQASSLELTLVSISNPTSSQMHIHILDKTKL